MSQHSPSHFPSHLFSPCSSLSLFLLQTHKVLTVLGKLLSECEILPSIEVMGMIPIPVESYFQCSSWTNWSVYSLHLYCFSYCQCPTVKATLLVSISAFPNQFQDFEILFPSNICFPLNHLRKLSAFLPSLRNNGERMTKQSCLVHLLYLPMSGNFLLPMASVFYGVICSWIIWWPPCFLISLYATKIPMCDHV